MKWLSILVVVLSLPFALAATNCLPPTGQDWVLNSTNGSLTVCDNGTAVNLGSYALLVTQNATITFANATNLTAGNVTINSASASFTLDNQSSTNATILLSAGNVTVRNGASLTGSLASSMGTIVNISSTTAQAGTLTVGGMFVATNVNLTAGNTTFTGATTIATARLNLTNLTIAGSAVATLLHVNSTSPVTIDGSADVTLNDTLFSNTTLTLLNGSLDYVDTRDIYNLTMNAYNASIITFDNINDTTSQGLHVSLRENELFSLMVSSIDTLFLYGAGIAIINRSSIFNFGAGQSSTATITVTDTNITYFRPQAAAIFNFSGTNRVTSEVFVGSNMPLVALIRGNVTFTAIEPVSVTPPGNLTRIYPLALLNETGSPIASRTVRVLGLNRSIWTGDWTPSGSVFAVTFDATVPQATFVNATTTIASTMSLQGDTYNGTFNYQGVLHNATMNATEGVLRLLNLGNGSNYVIVMEQETRSPVWSGTSNSAGYLEPNVTFDATTYNETFLLSVDGYTANQTTNLTLLEDTPLAWTLDTKGPSIALGATALPIFVNTFGFNVTFGNDTVYANYTLRNGSATWMNATFTAAQLSAANWTLRNGSSFDGTYLPAGNWTLTVIAKDQYNNSNTTAANYTSETAIVSTLTSDEEQDATIGGSDISFTFTVTGKGGSVVKSYLILASPTHTYNTGYARLIGPSSNVSVGSDTGYTGAGNVTLAAITSWPSYVALNLTNANIASSSLTISITPYRGLSAGTYGGSYGFGLFG